MRKKITQSEVHVINFNEHEVPVNIHYETRGNSRVSITKSGIQIRISRFLNNKEKLAQINEFKNWALEKLKQRPELIRPQRKDYYSGKVISIRDRSFLLDLEFVNTRSNTAEINDRTFLIKLSALQSEQAMEKTISQLISKCVAKCMYPWLHERLNYLNTRHFPSRRFKMLRLKYASSLWGSCSHAGNISISTRLLLTPDAVLDYVLIHELAHLVVPNHSNKFWELVASVLPDYEQSEKWLKEFGRYCDF